VKRESRLLLPTPESPISTILKRKSYSSDDTIAVVVAVVVVVVVLVGVGVVVVFVGVGVVGVVFFYICASLRRFSLLGYLEYPEIGFVMEGWMWIDRSID